MVKITISEDISKWLVLPLLFIILVIAVIGPSIFGNVPLEQHIYFEIVFLLLLAVIGELAVIYLKQPSVMILMLLGVLISPSFLEICFHYLDDLHLPFNLPREPPHLLRSEEVLHTFAQLGAIVLLFKVGLHNKFEGIFRTDNLLVALAGVIIPFIGGYLYAVYEGGNFAYSMFLGAALTATSVGVTVALLKEMNLMQERFAQVIIGAAVLDDVLGLLVLSFVINASSAATFSEAMLPIVMTLISTSVFLFGTVMAGDYFVRYLDRKEMSARRLLLVFAFMLMCAYVAEFIKLSAIVGAFLAGVVLNRSRHIDYIENNTYSLELLFMPIFFITMGMLVDVDALISFVVPIAIITVIAILTKTIGCGVGALAGKLNPYQSFLVGLGMAPRGEVALIIAGLGLTKKVLNIQEYSVISAMALLTTFVTPFILSWLIRNYKKE
ncbi:MAG: cation:proton antiporter [Candidatus Bilamarchaeaceae archaeon]